MFMSPSYSSFPTGSPWAPPHFAATAHPMFPSSFAYAPQPQPPFPAVHKRRFSDSDESEDDVFSFYPEEYDGGDPAPARKRPMTDRMAQQIRDLRLSQPGGEDEPMTAAQETRVVLHSSRLWEYEDEERRRKEEEEEMARRRVHVPMKYMSGGASSVLPNGNMDQQQALVLYRPPATIIEPLIKEKEQEDSEIIRETFVRLHADALPQRCVY